MYTFRIAPVVTLRSRVSSDRDSRRRFVLPDPADRRHGGGMCHSPGVNGLDVYGSDGRVTQSPNQLQQPRVRRPFRWDHRNVPVACQPPNPVPRLVVVQTLASFQVTSRLDYPQDSSEGNCGTMVIGRVRSGTFDASPGSNSCLKSRVRLFVSRVW